MQLNLEYPTVDYSSLKNDIVEKKIKNNNNNKKFRVRIRFNRNKKISVDRYIQSKNSMDPFDDSFNDNIFYYGKYDSNFNNDSINYNYFENLLKEFYQQKYKYLEFITENDEDNDIFFRNKKSNKRLLSKKRENNK